MYSGVPRPSLMKSLIYIKKNGHSKSGDTFAFMSTMC